jgi:hypothetical protein
MDAVLILVDSDAELASARALVDWLWETDKPADVAAGMTQSIPARRTRGESTGYLRESVRPILRFPGVIVPHEGGPASLPSYRAIKC